MEIRGGVLGAARLRLAVEEHGGGKQFLRWRAWPRISPAYSGIVVAMLALAGAAATGRGRFAASVLFSCAMLMALRAIAECGWALGAVRASLRDITERARSVQVRASPRANFHASESCAAAETTALRQARAAAEQVR
jgi:hypothetical protein